MAGGTKPRWRTRRYENKGDYGIDGSFHKVSARGQAIGVAVQAAALAVWSGTSLARGKRLTAALTGTSAAGIAGSAALYIYATKAGKFEVWNRILDDMRLHGDETVLDMGCGRGAVLLAVAKRLPRGRAIGVDLWQADQTRQLAVGHPDECETGERRRSHRATHRRHDRVAARRQQRRRHRQ